MSDEQRKRDEIEVEGHANYPPKPGANDEQVEDDENEFEAHIKYPSVRMD